MLLWSIVIQFESIADREPEVSLNAVPVC